MKRDLESYEKEYLQHPFETQQIRYRKRNLLEHIPDFKNRVVLEVGCGIDPLYNYITGFKELVIVEPGALFCQRISQELTHQKNVTLVQGTLQEVADQLRDYEFDYIIVSSLLHELPDATEFLSYIRQISGENTLIHIDVPNARSLHRLLAQEMGLIESVYQLSDTQIRFQQNWVFDTDSLGQLLKRSGFKIEKCGTYFIKLFTHQQMQGLLDTGIIDERLLDGLYGLGKYLPDFGSEIFAQVKRNDEFEG